MRRLLTIIAILFVNIIAMAQAPSKMSYQAVIRSNNALVVSTQIGMRVSIIKDSATGLSVYQETYNPQPTTNANGLVSVEIGGGNPSFGLFDNIDWSASTYFVKIETDVTGGTNYTNIGVSQFLSVPYALNAKSSSMVTGIVPVSNGGTGVTNVNNIKSLLGIDSLNNTPDLLKPISVATQNAINNKLNKSDTTSLSSRIAEKLSKSDTISISTRINSKAPINSPTFTGTVSGITKTMVGLNNVDNTPDSIKQISIATQNALNNKLNKIDTIKIINRIDEKLSKSDTLSLSTRINSKAPINSPTFTGTVSGITKTMVGLNNVDNTPDSIKQISIATQNALNNKLNKIDTIKIINRIDEKLSKSDTLSLSSRIDLKSPINNPTFSGTVKSSNMIVGINQNDSSAALIVNSTSKGFLPPRLSYIEKTSIISPAQGLIIYCNDCGVYGEVQVFNGSFWTHINGSPASFAFPKLSATNTPINITLNSATCGGSITSNGGTPIISKGVCWSLNPNPTINDFIKIDTSSQATINCNITGLTPATKYYIRTYASNATGTSYGTQVSFLTQQLSIGDSYGGGKVAYILQSGDAGFNNNRQHGLISSLSDLTPSSNPFYINGNVSWYLGNFITDFIVTGASGKLIGTGQSNTNAILSSQPNAPAAKLCSDYSITINGFTYDDWFLPSKDELSQLYINQILLGGFNVDYYWSSSEEIASYYSSSHPANRFYALWLEFSFNGQLTAVSKGSGAKVRAVRYF